VHKGLFFSFAKKKKADKNNIFSSLLKKEGDKTETTRLSGSQKI